MLQTLVGVGGQHYSQAVGRLSSRRLWEPPSFHPSMPHSPARIVILSICRERRGEESSPSSTFLPSDLNWRCQVRCSGDAKSQATNLRPPLHDTFNSGQACKLKFRLRKLTSCLWSAAVRAVCFEGSAAGLDATETGNAVSQLTFDFTSLEILVEVGTQNLSDLISSFPFRLNHSQYKHDCSLQ